MGTWLPETCWATSRREIKNTKVTSSWFFLSTLGIWCPGHFAPNDSRVAQYHRVGNFLILVKCHQSIERQKTVAYPDKAFTVIFSATKNCPLTQSCIMPHHKLTFGESRTCSQGVQISCLYTRPFVWTAASSVNITRHKTSLLSSVVASIRFVNWSLV